MPVPGYAFAMNGEPKGDSMSDVATQEKREYKFGDPVWVTDKDGSEREGFYGEKSKKTMNGYDHWCFWLNPDNCSTMDWFKHIRPREIIPDATPVAESKPFDYRPGHRVKIIAPDTRFTGLMGTIDSPTSFLDIWHVQIDGRPEIPTFTNRQMLLIDEKPFALPPANPFIDVIASALATHPDELIRNVALAALKVLERRTGEDS